jgi:hypothetical protein
MTLWYEVSNEDDTMDRVSLLWTQSVDECGISSRKELLRSLAHTWHTITKSRAGISLLLFCLAVISLMSSDAKYSVFSAILFLMVMLALLEP